MDSLRVLNERQGFFLRSDALRVGHDDRSIQRLIRVGIWRRLRNGAYTFTDLWPDNHEGLHQARSHSVAAKLGDAVALSHVSAALEHDLRVWGVPLEDVHVTRLDGSTGRHEAGVVHHEGLVLPDHLTRTSSGGLVTDPVRAALETASIASTEAGLVTLDSLLSSELATMDELWTTYQEMAEWPGMRRVGVAIRLADKGGQSVGESRSRYLFYAQGLPAPQTQFEVRRPNGSLAGVTDFCWPRHKLFGEFDGRKKYGRLLREGETPEDAVFREKRREDLIREIYPGWTFVRLIWSDLATPRQTAERIRRLLSLHAA